MKFLPYRLSNAHPRLCNSRHNHVYFIYIGFLTEAPSKPVRSRRRRLSRPRRVYTARNLPRRSSPGSRASRRRQYQETRDPRARFASLRMTWLQSLLHLGFSVYVQTMHVAPLFRFVLPPRLVLVPTPASSSSPDPETV